MMVSSRLRELGVKPESVSHCADSEAGLAAELKKRQRMRISLLPPAVSL